MNDEEFFVVGIDVGGTHTDAVLIHRKKESFVDDKIIASVKVPTTTNVAEGIEDAMKALFPTNSTRDGDAPRIITLGDVKAVFLGTTVLVNALLEGRGLDRVAVVRLCGPSSRSLPPFVDFPTSLKQVVSAGTWFASGGLRFDGSEDCVIDRQELEKIGIEISQSSGANAVVVSGTFSPADPSQELKAAQMLQCLLPPTIRVTISSKSGQLGLLARENSAILNACLATTAHRAASSGAQALYKAGLAKNALLFFTANDGSVMPFHEAAGAPLRCAACGPTNSLRGAAYLLSRDSHALSENMDKVVLDVGGTSTDAGCLLNMTNYPRDSNSEAYIAGVRCNHRTTDVVSVALGGGSIVSLQQDGSVSIGPESVGSEIRSKALCFGGAVCTATCIARAMGSNMSWSLDSETEMLSQGGFCDFDIPSFTTRAWETMQERFYELVEKTRSDNRPVQVVLVGGGSGLVDAEWLSNALGGYPVVRPKHSWVANACGSALAQAVGEAETIADMSADKRDDVMAQLNTTATMKAGPEAQIIECQEVPLAYLPGNVTRVFVRAVAPIKLAKYHEHFEPMHLESTFEERVELPPALRLRDPVSVKPSPPEVSDGMWSISEYDAHCLAIGCGILGCGGGGSTFHGKLQLLRSLHHGQKIRVVSVVNIPPDAVVAPCGFMGAPSVNLEMIGDADQVAAAVRQNLAATNSSERPLFLTISEIGGSNGLVPLLVGGIFDRPVVDADLMGRAFPELQMTTAAIHGLDQSPMTVSDAFGRCVTIRAPEKRIKGVKPADEAFWTERVLRPVCVEFGASAGLADPILTRDELRRIGVLGSLSRARRIGDCVLRSKHPEEAITSLLKQETGKCIFRGMISDVQRQTQAGFAKGSLTIVSEDKKFRLKIKFQNEFLIAWKYAIDGRSKGEAVGSVPDIICILDVDTVRPIATEEVRFGFRVCVLLLPVPPLLRSEAALNVVGPGAFSLNENYTSDLYETGLAGSAWRYDSIAETLVDR